MLTVLNRKKEQEAFDEHKRCPKINHSAMDVWVTNESEKQWMTHLLSSLEHQISFKCQAKKRNQTPLPHIMWLDLMWLDLRINALNIKAHTASQKAYSSLNSLLFVVFNRPQQFKFFSNSLRVTLPRWVHVLFRKCSCNNQKVFKYSSIHIQQMKNKTYTATSSPKIKAGARLSEPIFVLL